VAAQPGGKAAPTAPSYLQAAVRWPPSPLSSSGRAMVGIGLALMIDVPVAKTRTADTIHAGAKQIALGPPWWQQPVISLAKICPGHCGAATLSP
jgi:hypothetical protein